MSDYDFSTLNDKEFEVFVADLMSSALGMRVERFKLGRDGGVDGRFFTDSKNGGEAILQCKHWLRSGVKALLNHYEKEEVAKVRKLNPDKYLLITSLPLSRRDKQAFLKICSPYMKSESDVLGNEDLNDLLRRFPEVEQRHYKLWISSTAVLTAILNAAIHGRSQFKLEEIAEHSRRFVVTDNFHDAKEKLEKLHSVIITGAPGVGKTYLADQLSQYYAALGYQLCYIENSMNEAESAYENEKMQIFYYDDFLGRNFLEALEHHQDSHIVNFMKRVKRDPKKKFVLTSRSNVLNKGKLLSDLFSIEKIEKKEYQIDVTNLAPITRAKILYNHIWYSTLPNTYIDELYFEERYVDIIQHPNFNPRLISFITDSQRIENITPDEYWEYVGKTLESPENVWQNVFEVQLDELSRTFVKLIVFNGGTISEDDFRAAVGKLDSNKDGKSTNFTFTVRALSGSLINRNISDFEGTTFSLFNPSITDYVLSNYLDDSEFMVSLFVCLDTEQSAQYFEGLLKDQILTEEEGVAILEGVLTRLPADSVDSRVRWLHSTQHLTDIPSELRSLLAESVNLLFSGIEPQDHVLETTITMLDKDLVHVRDKSLSESVARWLNDARIFPDFELMALLRDRIEPSGGEICERFRSAYIECVSEQLENGDLESDALQQVLHYQDYDPQDLEDAINKKFEKVGIALHEDELEALIGFYDVDSLIDANMDAASSEQRAHDEWKDRRSEHFVDELPHIRDLFDRS